MCSRVHVTEPNDFTCKPKQMDIRLAKLFELYGVTDYTQQRKKITPALFITNLHQFTARNFSLTQTRAHILTQIHSFVE